MIILFTVCGRAGSKGIKNKNIKDFLEYPLPYYTFAAIKLFTDRHPEYDCHVVVSTDSHELINLASRFNGLEINIVERDIRLCGDAVAKVDVIRDCYRQMKIRTNVEYDMVVDLDITSPLRKVIDIENIVNKQLETNCDIAYSVVPSRRTPYFNMVKKAEQGYEKVIVTGFTARQQAPDIYDMNASIYAYSPQWLEENRPFDDSYSEISIMDDTGVLDLDHENDLEIMQVIAHYLYERDKEYGEIRNYLVGCNYYGCKLAD